MIHPAPTSIPDDDLVAIAVRKAGRRLVPFLLLLYILAFLDRVNVSYAKEMLGRDAGLSEATYALGAGVFFIAYALLELPSSLLLQRYGARIWIGRIMITWGLVSALTMFARTATSFCSLRFLLGAAEAGFFPGIIYYLTLWFPRRSGPRSLASSISGLRWPKSRADLFQGCCLIWTERPASRAGSGFFWSRASWRASPACGRCDG